MKPAVLTDVAGRQLALDERGYLLNPDDWEPAIAQGMAKADGIELSQEHWVVIGIFRDYFHQFEIEPPMRALLKQTRLKLGDEKGNSRFLYQLFPDGPGTQACRYAGLPRPVSCI